MREPAIPSGDRPTGGPSGGAASEDARATARRILADVLAEHAAAPTAPGDVPVPSPGSASDTAGAADPVVGVLAVPASVQPASDAQDEAARLARSIVATVLAERGMDTETSVLQQVQDGEVAQAAHVGPDGVAVVVEDLEVRAAAHEDVAPLADLLDPAAPRTIAQRLLREALATHEAPAVRTRRIVPLDPEDAPGDDLLAADDPAADLAGAPPLAGSAEAGAAPDVAPADGPPTEASPEAEVDVEATAEPDAEEDAPAERWWPQEPPPIPAHIRAPAAPAQPDEPRADARQDAGASQRQASVQASAVAYATDDPWTVDDPAAPTDIAVVEMPGVVDDEVLAQLPPPTRQPTPRAPRISSLVPRRRAPRQPTPPTPSTPSTPPAATEVASDEPVREPGPRTGRWLLVTLLGAIGLAVLLPLAVDALRAMITLG